MTAAEQKAYAQAAPVQDFRPSCPPPLPVACAYRCAWCEARLDRVASSGGCMALFEQAQCNVEGWGSVARKGWPVAAIAQAVAEGEDDEPV